MQMEWCKLQIEKKKQENNDRDGNSLDQWEKGELLEKDGKWRVNSRRILKVNERFYASPIKYLQQTENEKGKIDVQFKSMKFNCSGLTFKLFQCTSGQINSDWKDLNNWWMEWMNHPEQFNNHATSEVFYDSNLTPLLPRVILQTDKAYFKLANRYFTTKNQ